MKRQRGSTSYVFDKTGTLTAGKPTVTHVVTAAGVEPLAEGLSAGARELLGVGAEVSGQRYVVGSDRYFREIGAVGMETLEEPTASLQAEGRTCVWLGRRDGDVITAEAVLALADTIREESRTITAKLHKLGVKKVIMLTGDQTAVARSIAAEAGIDEFRAKLLPVDKVEAIRQLKLEGTVLMVGDGVNDAPALATAHLGVAMGAAGADVAMETADVVLMGDKLENVALLIGIARHAKVVLTQNLVFASAVILVLVSAALGFALPLPLGVVGHEGSTVIVCLNGLRLLACRGGQKSRTG